MDMVKIGRFIADSRKARGLTQQDLADRLGITNKAVSKWETGQGAPDIGTLPELAAVLQVTVDAILSGGEKLTQAAVSAQQSGEGNAQQPLFVTQTSLSRQNRTLCAKVCWNGWFTWARLAFLFIGIILLLLAAAGVGVARFTPLVFPLGVTVFCVVLGVICVVLTAEGYRLWGLRSREKWDGISTVTFLQNSFTVREDGVAKTWRYEHVTRILATEQFLVLSCGREVTLIELSSLPLSQAEMLHSFLLNHCQSASYRDLAGSTASNAAGLLMAGAAVFLLLIQAGYLMLHSRYQLEYQAEWMFYAVNAGILAAAFFSCFFLGKEKKKFLLAAGIFCGILLSIDFIWAVSASQRTQDILSLSPNGTNQLVLKREVSTGKTTHYRYPMLLFVRPYQQFPYTVYGTVKTQWLTDDICAVTYRAEKDGPVHQYVATFGTRGRSDNYYVDAALDGSWEPSGNNTAGWRLVRDSGGIVLSNGSGEERYSASDCVQFGVTAIVLCRNGLPQWTVALNKDCKIDTKTLLVSYGGTLTLCKVGVEPTAPMVLRSTSKTPVGGATPPPQETAEKYTYRIRDGILSFTWDSGHRWTNVPLPNGALKSIQTSGGSQLPDGSWHIAQDASYLVYGSAGTLPLTVLYTGDQGKTWQSHKVAEVADGITARFVCYTSAQTACVAVGAGRVMSQEGTLLYFTKDGGLSWQLSSAKTPTSILTGMNFLNQDVGYLSYSKLSGASGELYRTVDGGRSFTQVKLPAGKLEIKYGLTFEIVYDTPQVPQIENGVPVLYVTQGGDGDYEGGTLRARYESQDGGKTWQFVSQEKPPQKTNAG